MIRHHENTVSEFVLDRVFVLSAPAMIECNGSKCVNGIFLEILWTIVAIFLYAYISASREF